MCEITDILILIVFTFLAIFLVVIFTETQKLINLLGTDKKLTLENAEIIARFLQKRRRSDK